MSIALYRLLISMYGAILYIASFFKPKAKLFISGRKGLLQRMRQLLAQEQRPRIWMHCASLGEFEQGRPVLEKLRQQYPHYAFVITFFSPSGYEVRKNYDGADYVFYMPLDSPSNARDFIDIVQPRLCIFVKYELWYYYLSQLATRNIHIILISAIFRKDQLFFSWYGHLPRRMLQCISHIFVQNAESEKMLQEIGITNVSISGDTRFDRVIEAVSHKEDLPIAQLFCKKYKVIVAGSTWAEDEVFLHKALQLLPGDWKLLLVPHEVHAAHIRDIEKLFANDITCWSDNQPDLNKRVLVVDRVGLLLQLYKYGRIAWVGGGFGKEGVHNVLEAAVYGMPCAYGPVWHQFIEAQQLIDAKGAITTSHPEVFVKQLLQWDDEETYTHAAHAAKAYVIQNGGATDLILQYLQGQV
ncbi:MAG: glycosyltransferase N-terminal domain-containing protein [Bacteroidota bacterium]